MPDYCDFRGNKITIGSHILYPTRCGSSLDMNEAVVEGFGTYGDREVPAIHVRWVNGTYLIRENTVVWLTNLRNIVVIQNATS